ncbi:MAG: hypothetical protein CVU89_15730 [Firmicutes bacterium HGW-Firmicutes-14]|nr:MAG: hypothetical protein CVU89_15730 [Firmicutes bacterium HGW-Firmicutes-14]
MNPVITSRQNTLVKYVRSLRDKKKRDREKVFMVEGPKSVAEALEAGIVPKKMIISAPAEKQDAVQALVSSHGPESEVIRVAGQVMEYMSETETPPGIIALISMREFSVGDIQITPSSLLVVLEEVRDPGNVGTIIRTADAFRADAVILTGGCADLYNSKVLRSAMGSVFHIPVVRDAELSELAAFFRDRGICCAATSLGEKAVPLDKARLSRPLAIVFGSEARGISPEMKSMSDLQVGISMPGLAESLNVAVAAGIALYEASRLRRSNTTQTCK